MKRALGCLPAALLVLAACGTGSDAGRNAAFWTTAFDSTGDTIVARTTGDVPNDAERHLVLEQRIGQAEGNDTVTFGRIEALAVTSGDQLFVYDGQGPSLKLFDSSGTFRRFVGRKGSGPGEFEQVTGMGMSPNGNLAMWDATHGRVNVYSTAGDYSTQWRVPVFGWYTVDGLHADASSALALMTLVGVNRATGSMGETGYIRFDSVGVIRDTVRIPRWIDSTPMLLARSARVRAMRFLPFAPQAIHTWSRTGALLSGPTAPYVVYLTHGQSRPLRIERDWTSIAVLPEEATDERERITWDMRDIDPSWNWSGAGIPGSKPAYQELKSGDDGRIWVKLHATAERRESEEPPEAADGRPRRPPQRYAEPNVYDVFEASGIYLGRARAASSQHVMRMRGDRVWGVLTDSLGVAYVARWRVEPPFVTPRSRPLN